MSEKEEVKNDISTNENIAKEKTQVKEKKRGLKLRNIFVLLAIAIFALTSIVVYRAELLKVQEIGEDYVAVFEQKVNNVKAVSITVFILTYIITYISNIFIKAGLKKFFEQEKKEMPKLPNKSTAFILALMASVLCSIFITESFATFTNRAVFGKTDGVFGSDISYYMFTLPFIEKILIASMIGAIVLIAYTAFYYIIAFNNYFDGVDGEAIKKSLFIKQLVTFLIILVVLFAGYIIITSQNIFTGDMMSIQDEEETKLAGARTYRYYN